MEFNSFRIDLDPINLIKFTTIKDLDRDKRILTINIEGDYKIFHYDKGLYIWCYENRFGYPSLENSDLDNYIGFIYLTININ